jgi:hypothetical protein
MFGKRRRRMKKKVRRPPVLIPFMKKIFVATGKILSEPSARDWSGLIGLCFLSAGCYYIYPPAALVAPGLILIWKAILS